MDAEEQQNAEMESFDGSPISKFKSVKELAQGYKNLEKEFTQKCQMVKELSDKVNSLENVQVSTPEFLKDDWEEKVKDFFSSHELAKKYVAEISNVLSSDKKLASQENSLELALTKVLADKFLPPESLVEDDEFLEKYIYSNKKISDKIVANYLESLQQNRALPLMSSTGGTGTFTSPVKKPKTIKDAGKMVESYFKK